VTDVNKYIAELVGTFVLVFMGCGAAVFLGVDVPGGYLSVALAFGLSIVAMAYVIGGISGCHVNPAVSLAMLLRGKLTGADFVGYVVAQIVGALAAAAVLKALLAMTGLSDHTGGLGSNGVAATGVGGGLVIEVILTFVFIFVIIGVTSDESKSAVAGLVIGLTLTFVHLVGIALTGTSVNPARSIGPALFAGGDALKDVWVFILAPLVGAALAVIVHRAIAAAPAAPVAPAAAARPGAPTRKR
jgi:aquaporin Z